MGKQQDMLPMPVAEFDNRPSTAMKAVEQIQAELVGQRVAGGQGLRVHPEQVEVGLLRDPRQRAAQLGSRPRRSTGSAPRSTTPCWCCPARPVGSC